MELPSPHLDVTLDHAASLAARVVTERQLESEEVERIIHLFETQAEFFASLARWFREEQTTELPPEPAARLAIADSYRPWKPGRLVDPLVMEVGVRAIAQKTVRPRECHDAATYADQPMAAALLVEAIAHTALLSLQGLAEDVVPPPAKVTAWLHRPVHAGDTIIIECEVQEEKFGFALVEGRAKLDDAVVAKATFLFQLRKMRVTEPPKPPHLRPL